MVASDSYPSYLEDCSGGKCKFKARSQPGQLSEILSQKIEIV